MKFYKALNIDHPTHTLPTVLWNPEKDEPVFEFRLGPSGILEFETDDPALIDMLTSAGYGWEAEPSRNLPTMSIYGANPDGVELPKPELTEETRKILVQRKMR